MVIQDVYLWGASATSLSPLLYSHQCRAGGSGPGSFLVGKNPSLGSNDEVGTWQKSPNRLKKGQSDNFHILHFLVQHFNFQGWIIFEQTKRRTRMEVDLDAEGMDTLLGSLTTSHSPLKSYRDPKKGMASLPRMVLQRRHVKLWWSVPSLKLTVRPWKSMVERFVFLLGMAHFQGRLLLVLGRVNIAFLTWGNTLAKHGTIKINVWNGNHRFENKACCLVGCLFVSLFVCLFLFVCLYVCLFSLFVCLFVCLFFSFVFFVCFLCLFSLFVCLFVCLFVSLIFAKLLRPIPSLSFSSAHQKWRWRRVTKMSVPSAPSMEQHEKRDLRLDRVREAHVFFHWKVVSRWWQLKYFLFSALCGEDAQFE